MSCITMRKPQMATVKRVFQQVLNLASDALGPADPKLTHGQDAAGKGPTNRWFGISADSYTVRVSAPVRDVGYDSPRVDGEVTVTVTKDGKEVDRTVYQSGDSAGAKLFDLFNKELAAAHTAKGEDKKPAVEGEKVPANRVRNSRSLGE